MRKTTCIIAFALLAGCASSTLSMRQVTGTATLPARSVPVEAIAATATVVATATAAPSATATTIPSPTYIPTATPWSTDTPALATSTPRPTTPTPAPTLKPTSTTAATVAPAVLPTVKPTNTTAPAAPVAAPTATTAPAKNCDPSYPTVCIPSPPPDLDCKDIPYKKFKVLQPDPHRFDSDKDGIGCES